jgi:hypothetical protein
MSEKCIDGCTFNHLLASPNLASKGATFGYGWKFVGSSNSHWFEWDNSMVT